MSNELVIESVSAVTTNNYFTNKQIVYFYTM
jgi:hypothetical protein